MWVTDLVIAIAKKRKMEVVGDKKERRSALYYFDIKGFLERRKARQIKERR